MKKYRILAAVMTAVLIIHTLPASQALAAPDIDSEDDMTPDVVETEYIDINTAEDFLAFADNCHLDSWSVNKIISLKQDIYLN